jgi:protein O-GlcNAc transferase
LRELGEQEAALASYREALRLNRESAQTHGNMGIVLNELGQRAAACEAYSEALRLKPDDASILCDFGMLLEGHGEFDEAFEMFRRAIELRPDFAEAYFSLGSVFQSVRLPEQAIAAYERALELKQDYAVALNNLSVLYCDMSQPDRALEYAERGLLLAPDMGALYANRQIALHAQGRSDEAITAGARAVELRPNDAAEYSNYLYTLNFHPTYDAATIFAEHKKWALRHAEPLSARAAGHANDRSPNRRLRIGYVSPYFRQHAVNFFTEPILASHDHEHFEVFCYVDMVGPDATTARLKRMADHWREVRFTSDEDLAQQIRDDRIDILVDLTGHIGGNRLLLFARKPAPVQVTYIGYQNTTGMSAMDYRLTDERADPPGLTDQYYTERLVRLERAFFCYQPSEDGPAVTPLPALANGYVTFGSFNNFAKVTSAVREAWWRILERVEGSRLLVLAYRGGYLETQLKRDAFERGIDPARIELFNKRPRLDYLALVNRADISLDPFPFNGHTTTCDAIWQGVPVVMLEGQTYVSRFGGSVLANVGLESLIAHSVDEYVETAVTLAANRDRLVALRGQLRETMAASPLLDHVGFTRNLERAYRQMWHAWCRQPEVVGGS